MSLTPADVAVDLRRTPATIVRRLRAGLIPGGFRDGINWRIDETLYAAWREGLKPADPNRIEPRSTRGTAALNRRRAA